MPRRNPNIFYGMGRRRVKRRRHGAGFLDAIRSAHDFIKKNHLISRAASALSAAGLPYAGQISSAASSLGYGRRRRRRVGGRRRRVRRRIGGSLKSVLTAAHKFVKDNRLVSKGLRTFLPNSNLHKAAHTLGYGRRRRVRRRRAGGSLKSVLSAAHKFVKDNRLVSKGLRTFMPNSNLHKAAHTLGYGRRRRIHHHRHHGGANFFSTEQIAAPKF